MTGVRVVACFGGMVIVSGMERMSFEVLRVLKENGAEVHCILNSWENHRIVNLVDSIGGSWSTGYYRYRFDRHTRNPWRILQMLWDVLMTSAGLLRDAFRFRATHVFIPEHASVLRNAPALLVLRALGRPVVLRLPNSPDRGRFYRLLWRHVLPRFVSRIAVNSEFTLSRCEEMGIDRAKVALIRNRVSRRMPSSAADQEILNRIRSRRSLLCVGQIAPFKGTHIAVNAALALLEEGRDLQLVVAGAHPIWPPELVEYFEGMQKTVSVRGHSESVQFVGYVGNVLDIMRESWLLLAPIPEEESFGNVILEAKSVGLPVVGFPRGGIPELIEHKITGWLCRDCAEDSLLEGIEFFLRHPAVRETARDNSLRSFRDPAGRYAPEVFSRAWSRLFSLNGDSDDP